MKNIKILFSTIFIYCSAYSQNMETLKNKDTVYIIYDKHEKIHNPQLILTKNKTVESYQYWFENGESLNFTAYRNGMLSKNNICKKNVFFERKDLNILSLKDLQMSGYIKTNEIFSNKGLVFYVVDKKVLKKKKGLVKRAYFINKANENM